MPEGCHTCFDIQEMAGPDACSQLNARKSQQAYAAGDSNGHDQGVFRHCGMSFSTPQGLSWSFETKFYALHIDP